MRTAAGPPETVFMSNGLSFFLRPDGTFQPLSEGRGAASALGSKSNSLLVRVAFIAFIVALIPGFSWLVARQMKQQTDSHSRRTKQPPLGQVLSGSLRLCVSALEPTPFKFGTANLR